MNEKWLKGIAFAGYASKTVVYCMLGLFVVSAAFSAFRSSAPPSQQEVFKTLLEQPFGRILLLAVVAGLVCYSIWRWLQAFLNTEDLDMSKVKDVFHRIFLFVSGALYVTGAYAGLKVYMGAGGDGRDESKQRITAELMSHQWGVWLVGAIGALIIFFAFIQFKHAFKVDFMDKFERHKLSSGQDKLAKVTGRLGFGARGVVYILIGSFFSLAAYYHDPDQAGGLQKAFRFLMEQNYGQYLLAAVGVGLITYGIFCAVEARFRQT